MKLLVSLIGVLALLVSCSPKTELTISGIEPTQGKFAGGDRVVISGTGFAKPRPKGFAVYFDGNKGRNAMIDSNTAIAVDVPAGELGKAVDVEIVFDDARVAKLTKAFTYNDAKPLSVDDLVAQPAAKK